MMVVLATGGSGGHLVPALKVAEELRKEGNDVTIIGSFPRKNSDNKLSVGVEQIEKFGFAYEEIFSRGLSSPNFFNRLSVVGSTLKAAAAAFGKLKKIKPHVVVGFGGYGAFPVVLAASLLKCPTLIHEQNVIPGRANRLLSFFVNTIAVSFPANAGDFHSRKVVLTGCPCHWTGKEYNRQEIFKTFGLENNRKTLLVLGGSQGSHRINEVFLETIESLLHEKINFQVIHICGSKDYEALKKSYVRFSLPIAVFSFLDRMEEAYAIADLVISRAGALTVTEIGLSGKPSILIPYPFAGGHQKLNAEVLTDAGLSRMIEEKNLSAKSLADGIREMLKQEKSDSRKRNSQFIQDASKRITREIIRLGTSA